VAQETWTAVVRGIHGFEGRSSVKTWIFRIAVNAAQAQVARERRFVPAAPDVIDLAGWSRTPHEVVVWQETVQKVKAAIADLGQMQREVIVLRDVYGWSADEVAERLGISDVHQRVLLHRARTAVVRALAGYLDAEELRAA
jgi:RNA polymerase sigma-70 factor (ECF subfamily)